MSSLPELQRRFAAALQGDIAAAAEFVKENGLAAEQRLGIYRNNVRVNFESALASSYPAMRRLVGEAYFSQLCDAYRRTHPSTSGDLQKIDAEFAGYLRGHFDATEYAYLADVAVLEAAYQRALLAADRESTIAERLAQVAADDVDLLIFVLHPSAQLVASVYPVLAIWRANRSDETTAPIPRIDLRSGATRVLLLRREREVELLQLTAAEHEFLRHLHLGNTLTMALAAALALDADFEAASALPRFVQLGAIVDCQTCGSA